MTVLYSGQRLEVVPAHPFIHDPPERVDLVLVANERKLRRVGPNRVIGILSQNAGPSRPF
jgi:hypothetical protein